MAFVPYMVGGFAVDKLMGGDGIKGALLGAGGGAFLPEMFALAGASSALAPTLTATELAGGATATAMPALNAPSILSPEILGADMMTSVSNAGLMSQAGVNSALLSPATTAVAQATPGIFELGKRGLRDGLMSASDYLSAGREMVDDGYENMNFTDKIMAGQMVDKAVNEPTPDILGNPPQVINTRNPVSSDVAPLVTQVQGLQNVAPQNMMGQLPPDDREKFYSYLNSR